MASQLNLLAREPRDAAKPRWASLRILMAIALALLAVPMLGGPAYAGEPGVCDTNVNTGRVDTFMQNTEPDGSGDWANGNMNASRADLVEGSVVPQRVEMSRLEPGENELVFDYDVWVKDHGTIKWAYDYVKSYRMVGGTITRWYVEDAAGPTATVYVTFDVPANVQNATLYYDLHIASELDHGAGTGAGSIDGSPYHGGLVKLNCAKSGANANQIAASAIDAGELTVVKDATPADGTDFHFSITPGGDASTFALDDDGDATLPDRVTYRVAPGTYTAAELDLPAGWNLAGVTCSKATSGSTATSRTVAIADDEKVTCTFSNSKVAYKDLTVTNTATPSYKRDYDWEIDKSLVGPATRRIAEGQSATVDYDVEVTPSAPKDSDFTVSGQITVANPNNVGIAGVTVTPSVPGATCTVSDGGTPVTGPVTIPGGGKTFAYTCAMGSGTGSATAGTSTVSLAWSAADNYGTSGAAMSTKDFSFAAVTPSVTDASVTVTDSNYDFASSTASNVVRATDGKKRFSYQLTWPGEAGVCKTYSNTATITETDGDSRSDGAGVEVCEGKDLTVSKTVVHSYYRTYDWLLSKVVVGPSTKEAGPDGTAMFDYKVTATGGKASDSSWAMSGAIEVSNPNAWPVTLSDITDRVDVGGGASCLVTQGTSLVVAANSKRSFDYRCTFTGQPSYDGTNTATVTWDGTQHVSPSTSASGTAAVQAANWAQAEFDKTVTVIDDKTDPANPVTLGTATWAGAGVAKEFTYTGPALAGRAGQCVDYTNNAWIKELPEKKASAKVSVCSEAGITVAKDVTATYDTTYHWNITKSVDRTLAEVEPGATAGFDYTVVAEPTTSDDSGWEMGGTITLTNPNTYKDLTVTLSDVYSGGGVCTPDSTTVVVPKASKTLVGYSCEFNEKPTYTGTNTVTASWDGGTERATATVTFEQDGRTDYEVPVYDDLTNPSGTPEQLGTAVWDAPAADRTFRNHLDLGAAPGQCVDHTNTAWLDATSGDIALVGTAVLPALDPSAQQMVTVCEKAGVAIAQDVNATYDTTYLWDITKQADRSYAEVGPGGTARFDYTVVAKPLEAVDSNWNMSGKITLTNPNTFKDATVSLEDEYDQGGVCTPDSATVTVPKGGTAEVGYTCEFETEPTAYTGTNTVTATWDGQTARATARVTFEQVGTTDDEVEVYDDLTDPEGTPMLLGTAVWADGEKTFPNSLDLGAASGQCVDYTNTAWVEVAPGRNPSAQQTVTVCEQGALSVVKDAKASYDRTYEWDIRKSVSPESAEIPAGRTQDFEYAVTAVPTTFHDSGWEMTGTITVSNPNEYRSVDASLDDVYDNGTTDPADDVECTVTYPGGLDHLVVPKATKAGDALTPGKASATYSCGFTSEPAYSGQNHVTVTWGDGRSQSFAKPVVFEQDQAVDKQVTVYDDKVDLQTPVALGEATWAWDDRTDEPIPTVFPYTLSQEGVPGQCAEYTNTAHLELTQPGAVDPTASAKSTLCVEQALAVTNTVEASYDRSYHWLIDKSVDRTSVEGADARANFDYTVKATPNGSTDSGYAMGGTITVTNPNTYAGGTITTTVTDVPSVGGGATCTVAGGDNLTLAPEESRMLGYTCSFPTAPSYDGTDTATATWTGPDQASRSSAAESQVSFTMDQETDKTVTVVDDKADPSAPPVTLGLATWDAPEADRTFTYALTHQGTENRCVDFTNTASIRETQQSDKTTVTVCDRGDLVVTYTAEGSYDRTYEWGITKVADRTRLDLDEGETGTVSYTVGVTQEGFVDSGWEMSGSLSVSNPNEFKDVTVGLTAVPDLGEGASCAFDETQDFLVRAGETRSFGYSCSFTEKPAYDGTYTVGVDWGDNKFEDTSKAPFELDQVEDGTVTVTDDLLDPSEIGRVTWDEGDKEFEYALDFEGKPGQCDTVTNTATIVETGQDATADVEVCGNDAIEPAEEERQPPVRPRPPTNPLPPILPERTTKPRPPVTLLPETGAPVGAGIWTTLGGLMLATGAALLLRRRRSES